MNSNESYDVLAFKYLREYLGENKWIVEEIEGKHAFRSVRPSEVCESTCFFQVNVELHQFLFYVVADFRVLPEMLSQAAEFIARANSGMRIGNFDIDFGDGQVCFRSSINFEGDRLSKALIHGVIEPALEAYDLYLPGLARVMAGIETPIRAINVIEYGE